MTTTKLTSAADIAGLAFRFVLIVALVLYLHGSYQSGFAVLLISALFCSGVVAFC
jgi:hypothetical protein